MHEGLHVRSEVKGVPLPFTACVYSYGLIYCTQLLAEA